jgi:hypothetical protein
MSLYYTIERIVAKWISDPSDLNEADRLAKHRFHLDISDRRAFDGT